MKKVLLGLLILLILVIGFILFNTLTLRKSNDNAETIDIDMIQVPEGATERMADAIAIRTVSFENRVDFDSTQFQFFNDFMVMNYPLLHQKAEHNIFNQYSHLFKIQGSDTSKDPFLILAHHDVVPIASPALWSVHPFTEGVKNDTIYGRGCIDDKGVVVSILESVEQLLKEGFQPERTFYLSFGHDEEIGGIKGAVESSKYLEANNVRLAFVLDEGGAITQGLVPGVDQKTAVIGIAEKGTVSFELDVMLAGGHSSKPESETAIDVLSSAISTLKKNPFPRKITPVLSKFMDNIGPHMSFINKMAFANRWLFSSMILNKYEESAQGNASIRTTTAPTIFESGIKDNVVPTSARAVVNFRILPGETRETTKNRVVQIINDNRISVGYKTKGFDPSPISSTNNVEYKLISKTIRSVFPGVITCPNLVIGATDSRHFSNVTTNIYRFAPWNLNPENINCYHGVDERIGVSEFKNAIRFYRQIIIGGSKM